MKRILFVCTHNSARSQMAEALLKRIAQGGYEVFSCDTQLTAIDPHSQAPMAEIGIDMFRQYSKPVDEFWAWDLTLL